MLNKIFGFVLAMMFATICVACNQESGYSGSAPQAAATAFNPAKPAGTTTPAVSTAPTISTATRTAAPASDTNKCQAPPILKIASFDCANTVKATMAGTIGGGNISDSAFAGGPCNVSNRVCTGLDLTPAAQDCGPVSGAVNFSGQAKIESGAALKLQQLDYTKVQAALPPGETMDHYGARIGRCFAWSQCDKLDPAWVKSVVMDLGNAGSFEGTACGAFLISFQQL